LGGKSHATKKQTMNDSKKGRKSPISGQTKKGKKRGQ